MQFAVLTSREVDGETVHEVYGSFEYPMNEARALHVASILKPGKGTASVVRQFPVPRNLY